MRPVDKGLGLTAERLRALLAYDASSGKFFWQDKTSSASRVAIGQEAGQLDNTGYVRIWVDNKRYVAHRLAWLWMTGEWPAEQVDHIDGDRANNRWVNLRAASHGQNKANGKTYRKRSGLPKGVYVVGRRFGAQIKANGEYRHLGTFDTPADANAAYLAAAQRSHGEFANGGL